MNNHIWQVFRFELGRNIRRKGFLFASVGIPLLAFILIFGYQAITSLTSSPQAAPDVEEQARLEEIFEGIRKAGYVDLSGLFPQPGDDLAAMLVPYPDEAAARAALDAGEIDVYYIIAADYLETGDVSLVMPHLSLNRLNDEPIEHLVFDRLLSETEDRTLVERIRAPMVIQETNLQRDLPEGVTQNEDSAFGTVYIFSILFLMSIFITNGYLMQSVIEEKETRLVEILVSTVRPTQLLAGKILALGTLGILQIAIWLASMLLLLRFIGNLPALATTFLANIFLPVEVLPLFLIYFVLGYLFFAAGFGAVGALSNSLQEGPQYAVIFTIPAVIPFYLFSAFASSPEGTLPTILSLVPITAPLAMVMRVGISSVPAWQIILSITLLALTDIGMIWLAGRLFRVNTLLAGQVPKLRDLPRLLRG
jgi:ABC-2 type transport system permease protein